MAATYVFVGVAAISLAFLVTEQLSGQSPLVAAALALLVVLPAWMVFSSNYAVTLGVLMLYLGLVDGVLKLKLDTPAATLGRDVLLYSIVVGAVARLALDSRPQRIPPLTGYVLAFVVIVLVQIFNPSTGDIARGLAATRPHLEFVPLFFFGYVLMREPRRLRLFLLLLCVVAAVNGAVGLVQFNLSPDELASWGPGYEKRIEGTGDVSGRAFVNEGGDSTSFNRPFGLGPDVGFGGAVGMLAVPALLALLGTARRHWAGRVGPPLAVGIVLAVATSQTRMAVVAAVVALLAFGALAIASQRRAAALIGVAGLVALTVALISSLSDSENSAALDRYDDITPTRVLDTTLESRGGSLSLIPTYVEKSPLGSGLGQVGPATSYGRTGGREEGLNGESEFNFLLVELGIAGLLVFGALHLRLLALSARLRRVEDSEVRLLLAGCAAPLFGIAVGWITGPVSAATPIAPYFWFVAGIFAFWLVRPSSRVATRTTRAQPAVTGPRSSLHLL